MIGLRKKSLSDIVSTFTKTVDDLDNLLNANSQEIVKNDEKVAEIMAKTGSLRAESQKAASIQTKIKQLIS